MSDDLCMNCERLGKKKKARRESYFCSDKCGVEFCKALRGPVECECGSGMGNTAKARRAGWKQITAEPEYPSANFVGVCPECQKKS